MHTTRAPRSRVADAERRRMEWCGGAGSRRGRGSLVSRLVSTRPPRGVASEAPNQRCAAGATDRRVDLRASVTSDVPRPAGRRSPRVSHCRGRCGRAAVARRRIMPP